MPHSLGGSWLSSLCTTARENFVAGLIMNVVLLAVGLKRASNLRAATHRYSEDPLEGGVISSASPKWNFDGIMNGSPM